MPVLIFSFMRAPEREDTSVCPRKYDKLETYWFTLRKQVCVKICGATFPLCSDKISSVYTWTRQGDMEHDCPTVGVLSSSLAPFWFSHQPFVSNVTPRTHPHPYIHTHTQACAHNSNGIARTEPLLSMSREQGQEALTTLINTHHVLGCLSATFLKICVC